jgi:hypothetical protein
MRALLVSPGTVSLRYSHWLKHDVCSVHCVERMREGGIGQAYWILNPARLPIPPLSRGYALNRKHSLLYVSNERTAQGEEKLKSWFICVLFRLCTDGIDRESPVARFGVYNRSR